MKKVAVLNKNPDMISRQIDKELILVPIFRTSEEINYIYTLNESAARIWNMIDGRNSIADIKIETLKEFDVKPEEVDKRLSSLLKDLKKIKAIV